MQTKNAQKTARAKKLAEALKANLKRRKDAAKAAPKTKNPQN
jgi:hypothetical protein